MPTIINAGQTALTITPDATGALTLQANGTNALQITANGQITTANAPFILTGGRIQFPSTKIPSADGNCLDDYEEGTFTPTFVNLNVGNGTRYGNYIKVGRLVTVTFGIVFGSTTSFSGDLTGVTGLPFTSLNTGLSNSYLGPMLGITWDSGAGWRLLWGNVDPNSTTLAYALTADGTNTVNSTTPFTWGVNDSLSFSGSYLAA